MNMQSNAVNNIDDHSRFSCTRTVPPLSCSGYSGAISFINCVLVTFYGIMYCSAVSATVKN